MVVARDDGFDFFVKTPGIFGGASTGTGSIDMLMVDGRTQSILLHDSTEKITCTLTGSIVIVLRVRKGLRCQHIVSQTTSVSGIALRCTSILLKLCVGGEK